MQHRWNPGSSRRSPRAPGWRGRRWIRRGTSTNSRLDSTEALVLAGELEEWLGFDVAPTALWYFPTVEKLAEHIAAESASR
ncbi:acyl carrier protein [Clavibacter tessellarius]|uniref:acyl carrier protein n=1 Tax=Clavibacter tessellarius TaxID=31965 RepID=UPI00324BF616